METLKQRFEGNYLLGCIKYNGIFSFYVMPIAYWILNYIKYDPGCNPEKWDYVFRDNILNVNDSDILRFLKAIEEDKVNDINELKYSFKITSPEFTAFYFFIDFDRKIFVSSFPDIEIETYLPNDKWEGRYEDPIRYLPSEFQDLISN